MAKQPSGGSGSGGGGGGNEASLGDHGSGGFSSLTSATSTAAAANQYSSSLFFNSLQSVQSLFGSSGSSSSSSSGSNRQSAQPLTSLPLDERAQRWRAQSDQMGECRAKLATQEADIAELRRVLKSKLDEVSEMQIRRDLAEKRLALAVKESSGRQAEIDRLRAEMAEKEAELERTANRFNTEMREMVEFNQNMQEKFKDIKQSALMGKMMLASPGVVASSPGAGAGGGTGTGTGSPSGPGSLSGQQGNTSLLGMSFQTAVSSPGGFSSSGASVHSSSLGSTAVGGGGGGGSAATMVSGDVAELHQTVVDLRQAMKRMARRNYDLRVLLSSSSSSNSSSSTSSTDLKMSTTEGQLKPFWYVESLRRSRQRQKQQQQRQQQQQQYTSPEDATAEDCFPKFGDRKELQLAEMRHKLLDFKYEVMRARCSGGSLSSLPSPEALVAAGQLKPGWTRSLGELLKRGAQEEALTRLEYRRRYRQLKGAVEDLVKKGLEEGYACEADYATFLAPHISKVSSG